MSKFIIIWLLIGILSTWRGYHSILKDWYLGFNESYWDFHKRNNSISGIKSYLYFIPIFILGGIATTLFIEITYYNSSCWYFTTKNKNK